MLLCLLPACLLRLTLLLCFCLDSHLSMRAATSRHRVNEAPAAGAHPAAAPKAATRPQTARQAQPPSSQQPQGERADVLAERWAQWLSQTMAPELQTIVSSSDDQSNPLSNVQGRDLLPLLHETVTSARRAE